MQDLEKIYNEYGNIVYKYVFCLTGNHEETEEIVQETFLVAVKDIKKFRGECKISSWLCQISKYIWYKKLKRQKKIQEIPIDTLQETIRIEETLEDYIIRKNNRTEIFKIIQTFDEDLKNVMYLRILGNFEYSEIAEIMGKTSNWARVMYFRGKEKLKEEIKNEK